MKLLTKLLRGRRGICTSRSQLLTYCTSSHVTQGRGTIFALSSGHGTAGVAVIRVSGPAAAESLRKMVHRVPRPRRAELCKIFYPNSTEAIDRGLVLWFPGPKSFTGEDCAEYQVHGGGAVVAAMLNALESLPAHRHAEAGEFTKRAFMNGQLDLTEVEGLGDLIAAETEVQRRQALRQMEGELGDLYGDWRSHIVQCLSKVEAFIDFSEDENIEDGVLDDARSQVAKMKKEMEKHVHDNRQGERLRSGVQVAIIGEPNVGKSSLLNALCQRPAAIVSPIAGTTRDVVETALNIGGYPVLLSDTAGLRDTGDVVEKEGVRRALQRAEQADIKILMVDASQFNKEFSSKDLQTFVQNHMPKLGIRTDNISDEAGDTNCGVENHLHNLSNTIVVFNKCDLVSSWSPDQIDTGTIQSAAMSCTTGSGLAEFVDLLAGRLQKVCGNPLVGNPSLTQTRHRHHLMSCVGHLGSFLTCDMEDDVVIAAQQLHKAARQLGKITGTITSEDILDVIFKDFCIGK